jgi:glutathione S-transferase
LSGHCHRVELFLSLLGLPFERVEVDLVGGEQKRPAFLALNAFGQVPVIEDGAVTLADANAILVYLASRYAEGASWWPREPAARGEVQRWLSVAAGPLASGPAAARMAKVFGAPIDGAAAIARAQALFTVMEGVLGGSAFLAGNELTLADIANYSYAAHAPEGGVSLEAYPALRRWLARIEALPGFIAMAKSPVAEAL